MKAVIHPSRLSGEIGAIASKSQAHRLLICAALADRETMVRCATTSADIEATISCLNALGADIRRENGAYLVTPIRVLPDRAVIDCGESGSTLRFLLPVICALGVDTTIRMRGRLPERPLSPLWEELIRHGAALERPAADTIHLTGRISGDTYSIAANISSQFISGLLFALPLTGQASRIELTDVFESASYVEMTLEALHAFGIHIRRDKDSYTVEGNRSFRSPGAVQVEGDWSNAAFWICADRMLGGTLSITGLDPESRQGDRAAERASLLIAAGSAVIDCRDIPDLVPVLSVLAAVSPGKTRFINAGRLRLKESDRLKTTAELLRNLGGQVEETEDGLIVTGVLSLAGGEAYSHNDHRIAMSAAVASILCSEPVILHGAQAVNKSYPGFWDDFARLGGRVELEDEA